MIHEFYTKLKNIVNTGRSRSIILTGNINDLYSDGKDFQPLVGFLSSKLNIPPSPEQKQKGITQLILEVNQNVRVVGDEDALRQAWNDFKGVNPALKLKRVVGRKLVEGEEITDDYDNLLAKTGANATFALEFLRQMTVMSRQGKLNTNLVIIIEAADMLLPENNLAQMNFVDRKRIAIMTDWFSDPEFINGHDTVVLISESRSLVHSQVSKLPQVLSVAIPSPNLEEREAFARWMNKEPLFVRETAGLSLYAYRQLLLANGDVTISDVIERFIGSQIGEDVVEFKRPTHTLNDVIGYTDLKGFIDRELIPRFKAGKDEALPGACFAGPIGGGKSFIGEAIASVLGLPVLVLKNLRSMWYGQTDVIFERLKRAIEALDRVVIFVDEADTAFGDLGPAAHDTEKRLTGKIQAMMSDPKLRGKVIWLLMTARIHRLSPDIRRPGRVGDLIVPILDPEGEDRKAFIHWMLQPVTQQTDITKDQYDKIDELTKGYSAAAFAAVRSQIKAMAGGDISKAVEIIEDMLFADIGDTRDYQIYQALINCTRKSLIPESHKRENAQEWRRKLDALEAKGIA